MPTPASALWDITAGPDGNVWFSEEAAGKIGRITPTGVITEFPVPTSGADVRGITAAPDGNVWFTEGFASKIGRITPTGVITEFPVPLPPGCFESVLWDITAGPDGNLWFTDLSAASSCAQIGRITPSGVVTGQFLQAAEYIAAGPDGNLWFTDYSPTYGLKIGSITTDGAVTEYPVLGASSSQAITAGPDGNLWFTEGGRHVGRITPAGAITLFQVPTPSSLPWGIAPGADGNLWFSEYKGGRIGRISLIGKIREVPITTSHHPGPKSITLGPDANLWFIEYDANKIGRITDAPSPVRRSLRTPDHRAARSE